VSGFDARLKAKIALEGGAGNAMVADLANVTRSIQIKSTPGRSSFRSRRRGASGLETGAGSAKREREIELSARQDGQLSARQDGQLIVARDFLARRRGR
jgi:hypothetical protein